MTWLTNSTKKISENVPKIDMLQLKFIKLEYKTGEIELEKLYDSDVLEWRNEEQPDYDVETEDFKKLKKKVKIKMSIKSRQKLPPRGVRNLDTHYNPILYTQET